jgi:hypothetical protein
MFGYPPKARFLDRQKIVFRKPHCSATKKSRVYCVGNIEKIVLLRCKEYFGSSITFFYVSYTIYALGEVDFWIFWIFNFLQFAIYGKNNSKTKVERAFFFIFMSSYAEMSFLKPKITK